AMKQKNISLHELTALQVNFSGERARHPIARTSKKISGNPDHLGNIINTRPFVNSRKRSRNQMEGSASASESIQAESEHEETSRRKKRRGDRYFPEVLPYLHPPAASDNTREGHFASYSGDSLPSSDLLKTIHHFASNYYAQRGLLKGASRTKRAGSSPNGKQADSELPSDSSRDFSSQEERTEEDEESLSSSLNKGKEKEVKSREKGKDLQRFTHMESLGVLPLDISSRNQEPFSNKVKDMYRAFDGSALLLIGASFITSIEQERERRHRAGPKERQKDQEAIARSIHSSSSSETSTTSSQGGSSSEEIIEGQGNSQEPMDSMREDEREKSSESGSRSREETSHDETTNSDTETEGSTNSTDTSSS
ncbi:3042_t:CDS:2, partial [Acaulospora colombiana]